MYSTYTYIHLEGKMLVADMLEAVEHIQGIVLDTHLQPLVLVVPQALGLVEGKHQLP